MSFDPQVLRTALREGRHGVLRDPAAVYADQDAPGDVARLAIGLVVEAWLAGERWRAAPALAEAARRLEAAEAADEAIPDHPLLHAAGRRRALGLARWLTDDGDATAADRSALMSSRAYLEALRNDGAALADFVEAVLGDALLDALLAGRPREGLAAFGRIAREARAAGRLRASALLALELCEELAHAGWRPALLAAAEKGLARLGDGAFIASEGPTTAARWLRLVFHDSGVIRDAEAALVKLYDLDESLIPPWLAGDAETASRHILLPAGTGAETIEAAAIPLGYRREAGAGRARAGGAREAGAPVSWSRPQADEGELDLETDEGGVVLALRGLLAPIHGRALAAALGGLIAGAPLDLTSVARLASGRLAGAGGLSRWQTLQELSRRADRAEPRLLAALVEAGLADADWRVRMTAALAVGRLRIAALAAACRAAQPPLPAEKLVPQEERRCLLVLRDAAALLAEGRSAEPEGSAARREAFAEARAILAGEAGGPWTRMRALAAVLLGDAPPEGASIPPEWRRWMAEGGS